MSENESEEWTIGVRLNFPADKYDTYELFDDDTEIDFIRRALQRFKPVLDDLVDCKLVSSYQVTEVPHRIPKPEK